jgi:hypothetical protein
MAVNRSRRLAYEPTPDGYVAWKRKAKQRFADSTEKKYVPRIRDFVAYAEAEGVRLEEQDATFLEMEYFPADDAKFEERYDHAPSASYARNRVVALKSYFDFLT